MWKDLALKRMDPVGTGRVGVFVCGLSGRPQVVLGGGRGADADIAAANS